VDMKAPALQLCFAGCTSVCLPDVSQMAIEMKVCHCTLRLSNKGSVAGPAS